MASLSIQINLFDLLSGLPVVHLRRYLDDLRLKDTSYNSDRQLYIDMILFILRKDSYEGSQLRRTRSARFVMSALGILSGIDTSNWRPGNLYLDPVTGALTPDEPEGITDEDLVCQYDEESGWLAVPDSSDWKFSEVAHDFDLQHHYAPPIIPAAWPHASPLCCSCMNAYILFSTLHDSFIHHPDCEMSDELDPGVLTMTDQPKVSYLGGLTKEARCHAVRWAIPVDQLDPCALTPDEDPGYIDWRKDGADAEA